MLSVRLGFQPSKRNLCLKVKHTLVFLVKDITVGFSGAQKLDFGRGTVLKVTLSEYCREFWIVFVTETNSKLFWKS